MKIVERSALVPYSADQMFTIINDIDGYPAFLPWCIGAEIINREDNEMVARLDIEKAGLKQSFTTKNIWDCGSSEQWQMEMLLVEGPFSHLKRSVVASSARRRWLSCLYQTGIRIK